MGIASTIWDLGSAFLYNNYHSNSTGFHLTHSNVQSGSVSVGDVGVGSITGHGNSKSSNNLCDSQALKGIGRGCYSSSSSGNSTDRQIHSTLHTQGVYIVGGSISDSGSGSDQLNKSTEIPHSFGTRSPSTLPGRYQQTMIDQKRDKERGMSLDSGLGNNSIAYRTASRNQGQGLGLGLGLGSYFGSFLATSLMKSTVGVGSVVACTVPNGNSRILSDETLRISSHIGDVEVIDDDSSSSSRGFVAAYDNIHHRNGMNSNSVNGSSHNYQDNDDELSRTGKGEKGGRDPPRIDSISSPSKEISYCHINSNNSNHNNHNPNNSSSNNNNISKSEESLSDTRSTSPSSCSVTHHSEHSDIKLDSALQQLQKILQAVTCVGKQGRMF